MGLRSKVVVPMLKRQELSCPVLCQLVASVRLMTD